MYGLYVVHPSGNHSRRPLHTEIQVARSGKRLRAFSLFLMRLFNGLLWAPERVPQKWVCISPACWLLPESHICLKEETLVKNSRRHSFTSLICCFRLKKENGNDSLLSSTDGQCVYFTLYQNSSNALSWWLTTLSWLVVMQVEISHNTLKLHVSALSYKTTICELSSFLLFSLSPSLLYLSEEIKSRLDLTNSNPHKTTSH